MKKLFHNFSISKFPITGENFAKLKKTTKFSGEPFENSLNNKKMVNYSKFSGGILT